MRAGQHRWPSHDADAAERQARQSPTPISCKAEAIASRAADRNAADVAQAAASGLPAAGASPALDVQRRLDLGSTHAATPPPGAAVSRPPLPAHQPVSLSPAQSMPELPILAVALTACSR